MISNFEIKRVYEEEILYIFIDDSYEFASINKGKKRKNFLKMINDFIKDNEIKFAGSTIAIVAGGLVIGNLFLNKSDDINLKNSIISLHLNPQIVNSEVLNEEFLSKTSVSKEIEKNKENEVINVIDIKENIKNIASKDETINTMDETKEKNFISNKKQAVKETVTVFRTNGEVLTLEIEEYLVNVVAAEMPASFNMEALKAQSVLARTYTRKMILSGKVLTDSVSTQAYKNNDELKKLWGSDYDKYYSKIKEAVMDTNGEVLKYNENYIEAVYHSTSNGYTEDAVNVWGNSFPYLRIVESSLDKTTKNYEVNTFFTYSQLSNLLGFIVDHSIEFNIIERNSSNRVARVSIGGNFYTGIQLRSLLGLRSADFTFEITHDGINIKTFGYGHGVGMSQYGANEMAKNGSSYKDILNYYYNGTSLVKETP